MGCATCNRQALYVFVRALSGLSLHPVHSAGPTAYSRRQISTTVARHHRPSRPRHFEQTLSSTSATIDDTFVPFENVAFPAQGSDLERHAPLPSAFAPPPPPPSPPPTVSARIEQEPFEPSIQLTGEMSSHQVGVPARAPRRNARVQTLPPESKRTTSSKHKIAPTLHPTRALKKDLGKAAPAAKAEVEKEEWQVYKASLKKKFGDEHWMPRKKVSPDAREGIRAMHAQYPDRFTTPVLAEHFKISPDAVRRILKSKWRANAAEEEERRQRWDKRGERIWTSLVEQGLNPPKRWRSMGIGGGPRRPAQDRSLRHSGSRSSAASVGPEANGGKAWMRSLTHRIG